MVFLKLFGLFFSRDKIKNSPTYPTSLRIASSTTSNHLRAALYSVRPIVPPSPLLL